MKKSLILFSLATIFAIESYAQKGSWYVGGNLGFTNSQNKLENAGVSTDNGKTTGWSFSPEIGTFLTTHVQLGIGATVGQYKIDHQIATTNNSVETSYGATLYGRYFFGSDAFKPFVGLNAFVRPGNTKNTYGTVVTKGTTMGVGANLNAGFGYALSKRVSTIGSFGFLGFSQSTRKLNGSSQKDKTSSFSLDAGTLGNRFNVGFYYTL